MPIDCPNSLTSIASQTLVDSYSSATLTQHGRGTLARSLSLVSNQSLSTTLQTQDCRVSMDRLTAEVSPGPDCIDKNQSYIKNFFDSVRQLTHSLSEQKKITEQTDSFERWNMHWKPMLD